MTAGFFGEVQSSEFITSDSLVTTLNITQGVPINTDTPWLKFVLDNEIIYISKKPIRRSISWEHIYQAGAVYGTNDNGLYPSGGNRLQNATVNIGDDSFKATLIKGSTTDPVASNTFGYDVDWTHNSEWNRLMYPIHSGIHTNSSNPSNPSNPSVPYAQWANYLDGDLVVGNAGFSTWTQDKHPGDPTLRVLRGLNGITYADRNSSTFTQSGYSYRPALRLV